MLFEKSDESPNSDGFGIIRGKVVRFPEENLLKVPHMGWNEINFTSSVEEYLTDISKPRFYFVHSYHAVCNDKNDILATCNYGYKFTCMVRKKNITGVQFHPEKSHKYGINFFKNFINKVYQNA